MKDVGDIRSLVSEDLFITYLQALEEMMQADASAVEAMGEPIFLSKRDWNKQSAEGWNVSEEERD